MMDINAFASIFRTEEVMPDENELEIFENIPEDSNDVAAMNSINELYQLICVRFGLDEHIYDRIVEHGYDIESLLLATELDINDLFPVPLLASRSKFRHHLSLWKKEVQIISAECPLTFPSSKHQVEMNPINDVILLQILNSTQQGVEILNFYEKHKVLDEFYKDNLISIIVDSYSNNRKSMSMSDIVSATIAILSLFPSENQDYYLKNRGHGLNPTGKLHNKAVNARVKLRNLQKRHLVCVSPQQSSFEYMDNPSRTLDSHTENIIWLTQNNQPWSMVEEKWSSVLHLRMVDIKRENKEILLKKWPLFKHSFGHTLVDIDYNLIYDQNQSQLFVLWPLFAIKSISYFAHNVKDKTSLIILNNLQKNNFDENLRDYCLFLLLHAVLKSSILGNGKEGINNSKWKPSIIDSQDSCILHCQSADEYLDKLEAAKAKYLEKGLTFKPIMIVLEGDSAAEKTFICYYEGILYEFNSFLKCLDITFKLFHVMDFEYPIEGKNVYYFIEEYFYNFNTQNNPNVISLLHFMKH